LHDKHLSRVKGIPEVGIIVGKLSRRSRWFSARRSFPGLLLVSVFFFPLQAAPTRFRRSPENYGLRCSACHEAWPMLITLDKSSKDNGYQLMNDRDSPVWQNPAYWPVTFRMTPFWHRESTDKITFDTPTGGSALRRLTFSGFDFGGLDILSAGTFGEEHLVPDNSRL